MKKILLPLLIVLALVYTGQYLGRNHPDRLPGWFPVILIPTKPPTYDLVMDFSRTGDCPSVDELKRRLPQLRMECADERSDLGDYVCWSNLNSYNGIEAKHVAFFFEGGRYSQVRVAFEVSRHRQVLDDLTRHFGPARTEDGESPAIWLTPSGSLSTYAETPVGERETFFLWTSHRGTAGRISQREAASKSAEVVGYLLERTFGEGRFCDGL